MYSTITADGGESACVYVCVRTCVFTMGDQWMEEEEEDGGYAAAAAGHPPPATHWAVGGASELSGRRLPL